MKTAQPSQTGLSPNLKLFALIVAAIIVALAIFFICKSLWESHEAAVAQEKAQAQAAASEAEAAHQRQADAETANLKREFGDQLAKLQTLSDRIYTIKAKLKLADDCQKGITDPKCGDWLQQMPENQKEMKDVVDQYNNTALIMPDKVLGNLPPKFDYSGNAQ